MADEADAFGERLVAARDAEPEDDVDAQTWRAEVAARLFGAKASKVSIGRYEIVKRVGRGATGIVYEAIDPELERNVAIKLLRPGAAVSPERAAKLLAREAKTLAKLSHPNVVPVYDVGTHDGQVFIALELVVGSTLREWLQASPRGRAEILDAFAQAGEGLAAAHAAGLVHRDFKPDNVLIGEDGRVRVSDFGIARRLDAEPDDGQIETLPGDGAADVTTHHGAGTPGYMAPEQFLGDPVDARTDQFSFCVALHEALWGARPFQGATREKLAANVIAGRRRRARGAEPVPPWLDRVVARGLAVDPARRFPDMRALLAELKRRSGRRPMRWVAGLLAGAGLGTAIGMWSGHTERAKPSPCGDGPAQLALVWSPSRVGQLRDAFAATGLTYANDSAERVEQAIASWGASWTDTYGRACEAGSDEVVVERMHCLQSRLLELDALVGVFTQADATTVEHAVAGAGALVDPAECLHAGVPVPGRAVAPEQAQALRQRIADAKALHDAGQAREAIPRAREAAGEAQDLGDPALAAEALLVAGIAEKQLLGISNRNEAQATIYAAVLAADAARRPDLQARALVEYLAVTEAVGQLERARAWEPKVRAAVAAIGDPPELRGRIEYTMALVASFQDDRDGARAHAEAALEAFMQGDAGSLRWASSCHNMLGELTFGTGDYAGALPHYERALQILLEEVGPRHTWAANAYGNMAEVDFHLGDYQGARALFQRSLAIREEAFGPRSIWAIHSKAHVADVELLLGEPAEALALYEQALDLRGELRGLVGERPDDDDVLSVYRDIQAWDQDQWLHHGLALAYLELGEPQLALVHAGVSSEGRLPDDKHHPDQSARLDVVGWVQLALGRQEEAQASFAAALDRMQAVYPPEHFLLAFPHWGAGETARRQGRIEDAREHLETALRLREGRPTAMPRDLGDIRRALADVRWSQGERDAALELAAAAVEDYRRAVNRRDGDVEAVERWIAERSGER